MPVTTVEELIQNCTQLIERDETVAGVGKRMCHPLLSVFLGEGAEAHADEILSTYFSCWSASAKKLISVRGTYSRETIESAIKQASTIEDLYKSKSTLHMVWYWDIMDADFDQHFSSVDMDLKSPVLQIKKTIFVFCSQGDTLSARITKNRLDKLIQWSKENNQPLILFSDATMYGFLNAKEVKQSYHMAASLVLMLNSQSQDAERAGLASNLDFSLRENLLWTMSYHACDKNFFDIIGVSLVAIINEYHKIGNAVRNNNDIQTRVCGENRDYIAFLDEVFENIILTRCPDDQSAAFWADLPYTEDIAALERRLSGQAAPKKHLWNLFSSKSAGNAANAVASLGEFWDVCVDRYYVQPVRQWLNSEEGRQAVTEFIYGKMTSALTLNDMKKLLPNEWSKLEKEAKYQDLILNHPLPEVGLSLSSHLHACACVDVKSQIYGELLTYLIEIMKQLHAYTDKFTPLLNSVAISLNGLGMDDNIERAYGHHMERLIQDYSDVLNRKLRPCGTELELLDQLGNAFKELVKNDKSGVYYYTLQQHIEFLMKTGAATDTTDIIESCFKFNLKDVGRLVTSSVMEIHDDLTFCIMNDSLIGRIPKDYDIGTQFIVNRCDRIERLCIYPVRAEAIS